MRKSVLYHFHLNYKVKNIPKEESLIAKECELGLFRSKTPQESHIVTMNPKAISLLCENEDDVYSGKIPSLKFRNLQFF